MKSIIFDKIIQFIRDLSKSEGLIPLHEPTFAGNEKQYLEECIDSTFVSSVGKFVDEFESLVSGFTGSKYGIATSNGTSALHMALLLTGVARNEEVITQPLAFVATANTIQYVGAHPVFIDVDKTTLGMSPDALGSFLQTFCEIKNGKLFNMSSGRRIAACLPVHTFGHPARIDEISDLCSEYKIPLIEDAAESIGSYFKGKHTGTWGLLGVLSFNGNKTITTGGGGMILTDDEGLAGKAKHLTTQAKADHPWEYIHDAIGYNYRMPNINAALGCAQMEKLPELLTKKRNLAETYKYFFADMDIQFFDEPDDAKSNFWLNTLILDNKTERDQFLEYSHMHNIITRPAWNLLSDLKMYQEFQRSDLKNAKWLVNRLVNIPSSILQ